MSMIIDGTNGLTFNDSSTQGSTAIGFSPQSWQNVTASRTSGTTYTNSTGRSIMVSSFDTTGTNLTGYGTVNGTVAGSVITQQKIYHATDTTNIGITFIVPAGATYTVTWGGTYGTIQWWELR